MTKDNLLNSIATNGYNVGFGAKKNFASHDIVVKLPSWIGFITLSVGIAQLAFENLAQNKWLSVVLILVSVGSLYISVFNSSVDKFEKEGIRLTIIFNKLRDLYHSVQPMTKTDYSAEKAEMDALLVDFYSNAITKQVFLSQWYAHFKFFYEMQIGWVNEQLEFKFFRDKFPNSLKFSIIIILILIALLLWIHR